VTEEKEKCEACSREETYYENDGLCCRFCHYFTKVKGINEGFNGLEFDKILARKLGLILNEDSHFHRPGPYSFYGSPLEYPYLDDRLYEWPLIIWEKIEKYNLIQHVITRYTNYGERPPRYDLNYFKRMIIKLGD